MTDLVMPRTSFKLTITSKWRFLIPCLRKHSISTFDAVRTDDKHRRIHFCRHCGSVIYRESEMYGFRDLVFVPVGTLDEIDLVANLREEECY